MSFRDDWPKNPDGSDFDGKGLLKLVRSGCSPFQSAWNVELLISEIEEKLGSKIADIPSVLKGSNNYGFDIKMENGARVLARLARGDVNMPDFDGFPVEEQVAEVEFEAAAYTLLRSEATILPSRLLYHRVPVLDIGRSKGIPATIKGRRLFVFEKADGENNVWADLDSRQKINLLVQCANIRAALFKFRLPIEFAARWLRERLFAQRPDSFPILVAPTRDFTLALLTSKIEATIKTVGDMIGWEDDNEVVGPIAAAAKRSMLHLLPQILPVGSEQLESALYRLVLEHGDFGIHNMSIARALYGDPFVTSVYDWETGRIVPAILSDPLMAVEVDLMVDEDAKPAIARIHDALSEEYRSQCMGWAKCYFDRLYTQAPEYAQAIKAGRDVRHLWFTLREWRGDDPEGYFGELGAWAEKRMKELMI